MAQIRKILKSPRFFEKINSLFSKPFALKVWHWDGVRPIMNAQLFLQLYKGHGGKF